MDEFVIAYLNNIIIYSNIKVEYKKHIKWVLKTLSKKNIFIAIKKCEFHIKKTNFIRFIIELKQINMDLKKIKAIVNWQDLKSVISLKLFLKICNYYRKFIAKWLDKTKLFTKITKKMNFGTGTIRKKII